jgi:predicted transcriptional regulator
MSPRRSRANGSLEREVIACLATAGRPLTASEVRAGLGGDLAYATIVTTLSRLHDKGALTRTQHGRAYAYRLAGDTSAAQASVTAHQMRRLMDSSDDPASVLTRFVGALDDEAERLLRQLLDQAGQDPGEGGR